MYKKDGRQVWSLRNGSDFLVKIAADRGAANRAARDGESVT